MDFCRRICCFGWCIIEFKCIVCSHVMHIELNAYCLQLTSSNLILMQYGFFVEESAVEGTITYVDAIWVICRDSTCIFLFHIYGCNFQCWVAILEDYQKSLNLHKFCNISVKSYKKWLFETKMGFVGIFENYIPIITCLGY